MQIFKDKYHGPVQGQFLQGFGQFTQHSIPASAAGGYPDTQYLGCAELGRHLGHPERGMAAQNVDYAPP